MKKVTYEDGVIVIDTKGKCSSGNSCEFFTPKIMEFDGEREVATITDGKGRSVVVSPTQAGFNTYKELKEDFSTKFVANSSV